MDYKFFLQGIANIIFNPVKAWETIDSENKPNKVLRDSLFIPLLILVSISTFVGSLIFANTELSAVYSIFVGIKSFVLLYLTTYSAAFILREITHPLDLGRDFNISFRLIVYSIIPFILCEILSGLFESLLFVDVIGLYGLYIFWTGAEKLLNPAQHKKMPMLIATTISIISIYAALSFVLNMLTNKIYYAYFIK
jgi:Yip1 domain